MLDNLEYEGQNAGAVLARLHPLLEREANKGLGRAERGEREADLTLLHALLSIHAAGTTVSQLVPRYTSYFLPILPIPVFLVLIPLLIVLALHFDYPRGSIPVNPTHWFGRGCSRRARSSIDAVRASSRTVCVWV